MPSVPDKHMVASDELLDEIHAYCERTGTSIGNIGRVAFNHPGYVGLITRRRRTSLQAAAAVREVMAMYPDGMEHLAATERLRSVRSPLARRKTEDSLNALAERRAAMEAMPRVERDGCPWCGVRADIGCRHSRGRLGTPYG